MTTGHCNGGSKLLELLEPRVERWKCSPCINIENNTEEIKRADHVEMLFGCNVRWVRDVCPGRCGTIEIKGAEGGYRIYPEGGVAADIAAGDVVAINGVDFIAVPPSGGSPGEPVALAGDCKFYAVCKPAG